MNAPATTPLWSKCSRIILPNRLELLLRTVFALPKASRIGLVERMASASLRSLSPDAAFLLRGGAPKQSRIRWATGKVGQVGEAQREGDVSRGREEAGGGGGWGGCT